MTSNPVRCFAHISRAYYGRTCLPNADIIDEVVFGHYHFTPEGHDDGTSGEMTMAWEDFGHGAAARLRVYYDAWQVLATMPDLVQALGELGGKNIAPEQFTALLLSLGFRDITKTVDPRD